MSHNLHDQLSASVNQIFPPFCIWHADNLPNTCYNKGNSDNDFPFFPRKGEEVIMSTAIHCELNLLCLVILLYITYQSLHNVSQEMNRLLFRYMVYGIMLVLTLDTLQILIGGRIFPGQSP